MRLWSIHPKYLDSKGLVALWRETLLAKKVLHNKTSGYKNHPQLIRFKNHQFPLDAINKYLKNIFEESKNRGFNFNKKKIGNIFEIEKIEVSSGQIEFEMDHLKKKLNKRDINKYNEIKFLADININPSFNIVTGDIEIWEKIY